MSVNPAPSTGRRSAALGAGDATPGWLIPLAALFVALGPVTITMYAPAMPALQRAFDTTPGMIQLTFTVYLAAFALAQLVFGPLSDRYGRRVILIFGMAIYAAGSLIAAASVSIEMLLAARFVQAVGACAGPVAGRAIVRDRFEGKGAARAMTVISSVVTVGPAAGPLIGGYLQAFFGWPSIFLAMSATGFLALLAGFLIMPETVRERDPRALHLPSMIANYRELLGSRLFVGYLAPVAAVLAGVIAFNSYAPFVVIDGLGVAPDIYGWLTLLPTGAYFLGTFAARPVIERTGIAMTTLIGGAIVLASAVLLAGLMLADIVSLVTVFGPMLLWLGGMALVLPAGMAGALQPFPRMAGAASALLGCFQMGGAAIATGVAAKLNDGTAHHLGTVPVGLAILGVALFLIFAWPARGR